MSDFKAKMYRIHFRPLGELTAMPRLLARIKGPTSKGGERKESGMGWVGNGTKWGKGGMEIWTGPNGICCVAS